MLVASPKGDLASVGIYSLIFNYYNLLFHSVGAENIKICSPKHGNFDDAGKQAKLRAFKFYFIIYSRPCRDRAEFHRLKRRWILRKPKREESGPKRRGWSRGLYLGTAAISGSKIAKHSPAPAFNALPSSLIYGSGGSGLTSAVGRLPDRSIWEVVAFSFEGGLRSKGGF